MSNSPVATSKDALAVLRRRGLLALGCAGSAPSLAEEVAGEPVRGSWQAHPQGDLIHRLAAALEASPEVLVVKLVAGRATFLHRALWPALMRLACDADRVAAAVAALSPMAARLREFVEREGEVRLDDLARQPAWPPERDLARAVKELEAGFLLHTVAAQGRGGRATLVLRSWSRAMPDAVHRAGARLSADDALRLLGDHGAVPALWAGDAAARPRARAR
jgi:hypothetical protein